MKPACLSITLALAGCLLSCRPLSLDRLTCEYEEVPLALTSDQPRFGWQLLSRHDNCVQEAYRLVVNDLQGRTVWDSGRQLSDQSQLVEYAGEDLEAGEAYTWQVQVWDTDGHVSKVKTSTFRTAPADAFGSAAWIGAITRADSRLPEGRGYEGNTVNRNKEMKQAWAQTDTLSRRSICLRKEFRPSGRVAEALVYVCGLGHYELSLNGVKLGNDEFAPLWSDYDKTVYYNVYDVTSRLKAGGNAFGVLLGNGFYNEQGGRYRKLLVSFGPPTLRFALKVRYQDGSTEELLSDATWKYDLSPIVYNSLYGGEDYDARLEQPGWDRPGFNDAAWRSVVLQEGPKGRLTAQTAQPVKINETYGVKDHWTKLMPYQPKKGEPVPDSKPDQRVWIFDMGQNLAGFPQITLKGKPGDKVRLVVGESLGDDSLVNQSQSGRPHYYEYTLGSSRPETWRPRFSYYGFRYIRVEGAVPQGEPNPEGLPVMSDLRSCFLYNSVPEYGSFESSNRIFNDTHRLIRMAVRSNMQAVFTDCPHREKLGWLEQDHLNGPGLLYNYDMTRLWPKVFRDMADAQNEAGMVPSTCPVYVEFPPLWSDCPEWGSAAVLMPFMYYEFYGDDRPIREYYPVMKAYVDYLETTSDHHIVKQGLGDWYDFGVNRPGFAQNTPVPLSGTAHHYQNIQYLVKAARMLGYEEDAERYTRLGEEVLTAFHDTYYDSATGVYGSGSQASYAMPLFMGMVPPEREADAKARLLADIEAHNDRLTTGEVGNRYLFQYLARHGENELMYRMHNHEEVPGFGFQLKFGATTLTEQWDPRQGASWNHFMLGSIDEWFFHSLGGIQLDPEHPGGRDLIIRPEPVGDLSWVKCATQTLYGKVSTYWTREDGHFRIEVDLPANTRAKVVLPDGQIRETGSGRHTFTLDSNL